MTRTGRGWPTAFAALTAVGLGAALATNDAGIAAWLEHPARSELRGGLSPTTLEGARWLRVALVALPAALALLALGLGRFGASKEANPLPAISRRSGVTVLLVALFGAALRSVPLRDSLWYDELVGLLGYSQYGPGATVGNYFSQANHVLSQLLIWLSTAALGVNELTVRLPAFLASVAAISVAFALGREVRDERFGALAAAAMAAMPIVVLAGADARGYALVILGATTATWLLLRAARTGGVGIWLAYALVVALTVWSHLAALAVPLGHGVWLVGQARRDRRTALAGLLALVAAAALSAALYAPIVPDLLALRSQFRTVEGDEPGLLGAESWHALLAWGGAWVWWAALPGLGLAAIGSRDLFTDAKLRSAVACAGLGVPVAFALAAIGDSWLYARFLLFAAPATALLIAAGLDRLRARRLGGAVLAGVALAAIWVTSVLSMPPRQPLREAAALAAATARPSGAPIGVIGLRDNPLLFYAALDGVRVVDLGPEARDLDALDRDPVAAIVVLYPGRLPGDRAAELRRRGFAITATLPGWIDWGAGAIEVWSR